MNLFKVENHTNFNFKRLFLEVSQGRCRTFQIRPGKKDLVVLVRNFSIQRARSRIFFIFSKKFCKEKYVTYSRESRISVLLIPPIHICIGSKTTHSLFRKETLKILFIEEKNIIKIYTTTTQTIKCPQILRIFLPQGLSSS